MKIEEEFSFIPLSESHIQPLAELCTDVFLKEDPLMSIIEFNKEDCIKLISINLRECLDDGISVVAIDNRTGKVAGSYCCYRIKNKVDVNKFALSVKNTLEDFQRTKEASDSVIKSIDSSKGSRIIDIDFSIDKLESWEKKNNLLNLIDCMLLYEEVNYLKKIGKIDVAVLCDYYCVGVEYMKTGLSKMLARYYITFLISNGIQYIYGTFFNEKAVKILSSISTPVIPTKINLSCLRGTNATKMEVLLLRGIHDLNENQLPKPKAKF